MVMVALVSGCGHLPDVAEQTADAVVAPYRADVMICATLATTEKSGMACIDEVRKAWRPMVEVAK